jgi:hypothetical protein
MMAVYIMQQAEEPRLRHAEARKAIAWARELDPGLCMANLKDWIRPEDLARLEDGLRKAGLPET